MTSGVRVDRAARLALEAAGILVTMWVKKRVWRGLVDRAADGLEAAARELRLIR